MRLATLDNDTRDGELILIHPDGKQFARAQDIAPTLQAALDAWDDVAPKLLARAKEFNGGNPKLAPIDFAQLRSPLPRAYEWVDGSAYINHIILVRKARGAEPPETVRTEPLVYQGGSSDFLSPRQDIAVRDLAWGCDFESEVCVILSDTPQGAGGEQALSQIKLVMLANDVTLRNLIPDELAKGFGFFQSKPATAFSPFAITPDELGDAWQNGRVHLPLKTYLNEQLVGDPNAGPEMHFSFPDLIAHITKSRAFGAGTILGSGTVSNADRARGISCLAERRTIETIENGKPTTPFLQYGDRVRIEMHDADGRNLFGSIEQKVVPLS